MGYYTQYELIIDASEEEKDRIMNWIEVQQNIDEAFCYGIYPEPEACKWYDYDTDMTYLSKTFPEILFTLNGSGEESRDIWRCYYKGGKKWHIKAQIDFPDFDPNKLE